MARARAAILQSSTAVAIFLVPIVLLVLGWAGSASAWSWRHAGMDFAFDSTLSFGVSLRTQSPDPKNFCTTVGSPNALAPPPVVPAGAGGGPGANGDCGKSAGNLNYEKWAPNSTILKGFHAFQVDYENFTAYASFQWWYDGINRNGDRARTPLTDNARWRAGAGADLLDAYLQGVWYPAGMPLTVKIGNQVVSWGESTFFQNGVNVINPIDVSRLRVPGAELRDALLAVPIIWGSISPNQYLSFEAFYQFKWRETIIDAPGTYFSVHDALGPGGRFFDISQGHHDCDIDPLTGIVGLRQDGTPGGACIERGRDRTSRETGQFGLAARIFVPQLNASEFGLFFLNYHSRVPYIGGSFQETVLTAGRRLFGPGYTPNANPFFDLAAVDRTLRGTRANQFYPEDIRKVGVSFSTAIDKLSLAIQGEGTYTFGHPLQVSEIELLRGLFDSAGIGDINVTPQVPPKAGTPSAVEGVFFPGIVEKDLATAQATFTYIGEPGEIIGGWLRASQLRLIGEVGYMRIVDHDNPGFRPLQGSVTPQLALTGNTATQLSSFATANSMGYVIRAGLPYNNSLFGANITPFIGWSHGVWGVSPAPLLNYIEGEKAVNVGVRIDYLNAYGASISYTNFFDGGVNNPRNDRDFLAFDVQYNF